MSSLVHRNLIAASIEPWPICHAPGEHNAVLMSDGSLQFFRSYGRAQAFIEAHPAPTAREQLDASLRERAERADYHFEETEAELGTMARSADFDERFQSLEDDDPYTADRSEEIE